MGSLARSHRFGGILVCLLSIGVCGVLGCVGAPDVSASEEPIVGGTLDNGDLNVMLMQRSDGYLCSGSLISPHVYLTARHCVVNMSTDAPANPRIFQLFVGRDFRSFTRSYRVASVHIIPGSTGNIMSGAAEDLGILVLSSAATETPFTLSRQSSTMLRGMTITAIGFGQTPTADAGVKYRANGMVTMTDSGLVFVDPTVCEGDSGGPLIGPDGNVWGVASFIYSPDRMTPPMCGTAPGAYNSIFSHLDWIDSVLVEAGDLCIPTMEICDGVDNDCNGMADEGCLMDGEACTDAAHCTSGHCESTSAGMICTSVCDATRPGFGCADGFHCVNNADCSGFCVPGAPGTLGIGIACTSNAQCASGDCQDPGDGNQRCLAACFGDAGQCASGEACTASAGGCGACVPERILASARGLGEECTDGTQCRSGLCLQRAGIGECATPCTSDTPSCPAGFVCQGDDCVLDRSQPSGGSCAMPSDCFAGTCASDGHRSWCSPTDCTPDSCPTGFACTAVGAAMVCTPTLALPGDTCSGDAQCASGACFMGACTTTCTEANDCAPGSRCVRTDDGTSGHCIRATPPPAANGCACHVGASGGRASWALLGLVIVGWIARRRRARR